MPHTSDGAAAGAGAAGAAAAANRRGGTKRKRTGDHRGLDASNTNATAADGDASSLLHVLPVMSPDGDSTRMDVDHPVRTASAASAPASNKRPRFAVTTTTSKTSGSGSDDSGNSSAAGGQSSSSTGNEGEASNSASSTMGTTSTSTSDRGGASTSSGNPAVVTASVGGSSGATTTSTSGRSLSGGGSSGGISGSGAGSGSCSEDRSTSARSRSSGDDERPLEEGTNDGGKERKKVVKISGMSELEGRDTTSTGSEEAGMNAGTNKLAEAMAPENERKRMASAHEPASAPSAKLASLSTKVLPGSSPGLHHHRHHHASKMPSPSSQMVQQSSSKPGQPDTSAAATSAAPAHTKTMLSSTAPTTTNTNTNPSPSTSSMGPPPQTSTSTSSTSNLLPAGSSIEPNRVTASGHATVVASSRLPGPPTDVAPPPSAAAPSSTPTNAAAKIIPVPAPGGPSRAEDSVASSLSVSMPSGSGSGSSSDEMSGRGIGGAKKTGAGAGGDPFSLPHKLPPPAEQGGVNNNNNNIGGVSGSFGAADDSSSSAVSSGIIRDNPMSVTAEGLPNPPSEVKGTTSSISDRSRASQQHRRHHHHHGHAGTGALTPVVPSIKMGRDTTIEAATDAQKAQASPTTATATAATAAPAKLRRSASNSADDMNDDSNSSSNSGSEGGYEGSSSSNAETREGSCSSPSVSSSEASGGSGERAMTKKRGGGGAAGGQAQVQAGQQRSSSLLGPPLGPPPPEIPPQPLRPARSTATSSSSTSSTMSSGENIAGGAAANGGALPSVSGVTGKDFTFRARDSARDSKSSSLSLSSSSMEPPSQPAAEAPPAAAARAAQGGGSTDDVGFKMDESFKRKIERACSAQNDRRRRQLQLMSLDRHGMKSDRRKRKDGRAIGPAMAPAKGEPGDSSSLSDEPGRKKPRAKMLVSIPPVMGPCAMDWEAAVAPVPDLSTIWQKSPIYCIGTDNMASVLAFLEPPEVHSVLTMPLSKTWRSVLTAPQELWKVLCLEAPFFAKVDDAPFGDSDSENSSLCSFPMCSDTDSRHIFGRYRLLYTSFVRCMRYLARIKDDAVNGRAPSALDDVAGLAPNLPFNGNASLKDFFHEARGIIQSKRRRDSGDTSSSESSISSSDVSVSRPNEQQGAPGPSAAAAAAAPSSEIRTMDDGSSIASSAQSTEPPRKRNKKPKAQRYGNSKLTQKLLGPSIENGIGGPVELPWSCAIYSVVNWMVAFADVEGIQVMCLKVLPCLLEDEKQRTTAQRAGLTDIVLRAMVLFPDSVEVHTAAFHTLVLLARPLGGHEGDLFHSAMLNASGIFNVGTNTGRNGIAIMLDSMRRFANQEVLQAMSCWSMVNIALIPKQKTMLVKLGGISVVANAMMQHPFNAEVQFRALFALINLVIPSENLTDEDAVNAAAEEELGVAVDVTERDMLDENVGQISNLVVVAMKNFCSSEAILNRACLVLHNLSLNEEYHRSLLWTPNCYQMLEWCIGNYRHDQVLQQSAGGTLQRLQMTLANDGDLRMRFLETIRAQQQSQLEQVRREAMAMGEAAAAAAADARPSPAS